MKSLLLTTAIIATYTFVNAQYCSPWPTTNSNTGQTGYVGIGTRSGLVNLNPLPNFNFHLHGTTDYLFDDGISGLLPSGTSQEKTVTNYGKTIRFGMTNTVTGMTETDGTVFRLSDLNFFIHNREQGYMKISAGSMWFTLSPINNRTSFGHTDPTNMTTTTDVRYARFNIWGVNDNGLYVKTNLNGKYGISVETNIFTNNAFQITDGTVNRYVVKGSGHIEINSPSTVTSDKLLLIQNPNRKILQVTNDGILRSREIIVDAQTWADYVFEPEYKLMPIGELRNYISENGHLPNVPSTTEVETEGVNVAKTDAILLEKIEELTLYMLQQEERMKALEAELEALKEEQSGN